ncbi:bacteriocin family protein [Pseudenhygromyxa sp. WMMC2535]|uniref:family 1 encapsulin nanocompartment shell protein n=1 Tax=Pseudenhygromyxa sp. WMMC2535 TaxID=2712867 RepID=UPI00155713F4|nr:family 1 encapsulin nanocompartment shell protein [Pseudenhygromyxa sp. WMMC2535]NVB41942.1 bacteriocin family protein [Pseudenhygromyxa sp. WMMC2535]
MDFLRRELAPLIDSAWAAIDDEARSILTTNLSGRRVVDLRGPEGWSLSAINLGRLSKGESSDGLSWGVRQVQPLVELRVPFSVSLSELDNLARGADPVELGPVSEAAMRAARFEERAIYEGFAGANIRGLRESSEHETVTIGAGEPAELLDAVTRGLVVFHDAGVVGPHTLVLGPKLYERVLSDNSAYPLRQQLTKLLGQPPIYSPELDGVGLLLSTRGGDFELTLGQDMSIGYSSHQGDSVELFITETLTFRVLGPEAIVKLG